MLSEKFPRSEKLKQKKEIAHLFEDGTWKTSGSLRIIFKNNPTLEHPKVGVSVSKRNFKSAVERNRIKRLLREAYRLNKAEFCLGFGKDAVAMVFWASKIRPSGLRPVEEEFLKLCQKIRKNIANY